MANCDFTKCVNKKQHQIYNRQIQKGKQMTVANFIQMLQRIKREKIMRSVYMEMSSATASSSGNGEDGWVSP